ncbi:MULTISPECIES: flagellar biosynthesis protein FlhF [unclassified Roseateles]|uniref:flagellar biosynthesis protein FlhF n=1 Tax=unclassified Roseateles TaxID=2626991 RepID=UPI0006F708BE|nr:MULTISPECIES: flagellar biosynthesis protein FlhF [unclassified Roseateles]KQW51884.1 flagellar biosynthesis protein FlhF [Pelomonas sp. Root405]KRA78117.1 flagellar biosynthesis protein FlhF [Pelomonas sp. Root662]
MNVRKFTARTSREALALVKQAFGADAVVLSNKSVPEGVEVLAMAPEGMGQIEQIAHTAPRTVARPAAQPQAAAPAQLPQRAPFSERARQEPSFGAPEVQGDVEQLAMSTLSFQDYVRERVLRRRQAELSGQPDPVSAPAPLPQRQQPPAASLDAARAQREQRAAEAMAALAPKRAAQAPAQPQPQGRQSRPVPPVLRDEIRIPTAAAQQRTVPQLSDIGGMVAEPLPLPGQPTQVQRSQMDMADELRQMRGLIEERFSSLAFMEKLQRQPVQARLTQKLLEIGFSPALVRKLAESCPSDFKAGSATDPADETAWAAHVLSRNLQTDEAAPAIEDRGGVFALIGSTGVGKTTTTAKLAAHFATKYGAGQLGLITLDAYRIGAHEQLRAYGRILGVPVHTAHDRASLDDLLDLLSNKKLVLIDTAGMAQRDSRTQELLEMLAHPSIKKLLVINAAQQGETIEDVVNAWKGAACEGVVLSKIDEAVKLAPALDTLIRHKLKVLGVANGQRVPEDWHRLPSVALVQRALKSAASGAWRMDNADVNLIFAGAPLANAGLRAVH